MAKALAAIESSDLQQYPAALRRRREPDRLASRRVAGAHRPHPPRSWPKRRHWKRRFVQDDMVARLARILRPGGEFRFVTDIADYAAWTLQRLLRSADFEWTAQCADDWRKPWPGFTRTRYHAKAAREGARIVLSDFPQNLSEGNAIGPAGPARSAPRAARSKPKAGRNWRRPHRAPGSMCPCRPDAPG